MKLHESEKEFKELIILTSEYFGMEPFHVEKDYWITNILKKLSESIYKEKIVFKGGTSLSKGHNIIKRFSEDIDLQLLQGMEYFELSQNQQKNYLKNIEKILTENLVYLKVHPKNSRHGRIRKTVYEFPNQILTHMKKSKLRVILQNF